MNVLVLGGAGYIGSHFVKTAVARGLSVTVVDNLQTGHPAAVDAKAVFRKGDIRNRAFLADVFTATAFDAVIHFAANSLVGVSMKDPVGYFDNNVHGTIAVLQAMEQFGVKKIVFSSSAAVYGSHKEMPITEDYPTVPTNPYGESKLMMEKMMKWADLAYGLKYVSLRYFNVAGASSDHTIGEDHRPETHLIPIVLQVPLQKRPNIVVFGRDYATPDGTCVRDYIHIEDLVDAHLRALDYLMNGGSSDVFNLGSNQGYSNLDVVSAARKVTGDPIMLEFGDRRPGDPDILVASNEKALAVLGWKPKRGLEEMIGSAWDFHRRHPEGYPE
ncbi:MAG: UDP-glucose 4-epimerase GalE [Tenericutes bacterium GWF2_57_13]|nr:MAG: UDP-glucose 4-epimerase GalE [Tenericutes bacterium GWF2_57_13]